MAIEAEFGDQLHLGTQRQLSYSLLTVVSYYRKEKKKKKLPPYQENDEKPNISPCAKKKWFSGLAVWQSLRHVDVLGIELSNCSSQCVIDLLHKCVFPLHFTLEEKIQKLKASNTRYFTTKTYSHVGHNTYPILSLRNLVLTNGVMTWDPDITDPDSAPWWPRLP